MASPRLGATELVEAQASPETTVNAMNRHTEQGASYFIVADKDLATPPGSPADGVAYIVAASPTGAWAGWATRIAYYSSGWKSIVPIEGTTAFAQDEDVEYRYNGTAWASTAGSSYTDENARDAIGTALVAGGAVSITVNDGSDTITISQGAVSTQTGTSYTAVLGDANTYVRFTNASPVTFTIPPNSSVAFPTGTVIEFEQGGAGALTIAAGSGVTVNSRGTDMVLAGQYAIGAVKKVATDTWTLTGDL